MRMCLLFCLILCHSGACDEPRRLSLDRKEGGFIAFVGNTKNDPVWRILSATAQRYRAGIGKFDLRIEAADMDAPSAQTRLLRSMQSPQMRGLCIWPTDTAVMKDILLDIRTKGIPVVTMMTPIPSTEPFVHSGLDEIAIGRTMAHAAFEAIKGDGTIALLRHGGDSIHHDDRYLGFSEQAKKLTTMTILSEFDCRGNAFVAQRVVREYVERFPRLNAFVSLDDWPLRGLSSSEGFLPDGCPLITYGPYPDYWALVNNGTCYALIGAEYDRIAENALQMCVTLARGEILDVDAFYAKPIVVKKDNLQQSRVDWFKWLDSK